MLIVPLAALALRLASGPTANVSYLLIAAYALQGRAQAIQALFLSWLFSMLNPALAPAASFASIGRYGILLAAALSIIIHKPARTTSGNAKTLVEMTLLLGIFIILHSLLFSSMPDVSVLKAVSWTLAMTTLFAAWSGLSEDRRAALGTQLFGALTLVMVVSLPMLALSAGYLQAGAGGFQGILGHPQAFGLTMALLGAWAAVRMFALPRPPWWLVVLASASMPLVMLSGARTAGLSLLLGVTVALFLSPTLSGQSVRQLLPGLRSRRVHLVIGVTLVGVVLAWPKLAERTETYITKRSGTSNVVEAYEASRGGLIDLMWTNIERKPLEGIGFGIASIPELMVVQRDPVLGLPTSAIIEKGVMPVAVLEELGAIGVLLVAAWLWIVLRRCARRGVAPLAVFLVVLFLNMGEATLFSVGGAGLLSMILIAWAATGLRVGRK
jgi:hypothetical protein